MDNNMMQNNRVELRGKICNELAYSHEVFGEKFYSAMLFTERTSGNADIIPLLISEKLFISSLNGEYVSVSGELRSYNNHKEGKGGLQLNVFVQEMRILDGEFADLANEIELVGYICKEPVYRKTPLGREIADILLEVNRSYGKSDYIPCICWGRNAANASNLEIGTRIRIAGRIQSREYQKKISETESETRTAYEVSAGRIEVVEDEK